MNCVGTINKMFLSTFDAMEEGVDYELTPDAFIELNEYRAKYNYVDINPFAFQRKGDTITFNWKVNELTNHSVKVGRDNAVLDFIFTANLAFAFAFPFSHALAENRIRKVGACEGKTVVIDGVEYELRIKK